jgi:hypothetical protein
MVSSKDDSGHSRAGRSSAMSAIVQTSLCEVFFSYCFILNIVRFLGSKNKKRPLKGYYCQDDDTITYYLYDSSKDKFFSTIREPQGRLHKQEEANPEGRPTPTAQWGNGHTHVQYPRLNEFTLGDIGSPLARISVKLLTQEFSKNRRSRPSGPKEWDKRIAALQKAPTD